jgi:4-hydroxybenzoyl-CoA thioesterase
MRFSIPIRVYIEDTDAGGIVYYVNYLKYMERARSEFLRACGFEHRELLQQDILFVVHKSTVHYKKPATMDEALVSTLWIKNQAKVRVIFQQTIARQSDGEVLCEAENEIACVRYSDKKPQRIPAQLREGFATISGKNAQTHFESDK